MGSGTPCASCNLRKDNPAPEARHWVQAQPAARKCTRVQPARVYAPPYGGGVFYNERRLLWAAVRFVWAVSCVRRTPPVRAEVYAGSTRPANQFAFKRTCRIRGVRGFYGKRYVLYRAAASMGSGALRLGCNLREENPAPQARIACRLSLRRGRGCRLSLPGGPARFYARLPHSRGAEVPMGSDTFYNKRRLLWEVGTLCLGCNLHEDSPAPAVLARRGMGAGSACGAEEHAGSTRPLSSAPTASAACEGFLWAVICFVWAVSCVRTAPRRRRGMGAGSACRAYRIRGARRFLWEVGTSYNERRFL